MGIQENIKMLRLKYNLSQKDLALIAGVSDKAVSTWENGTKEPRMGVIQKIADHFGLKKSDLIEDAESIPETPLPALTPSEQLHITKYRALTSENQTEIDHQIDFKLYVQEKEGK